MQRFYLPALDFQNESLIIDEKRIVFQAIKVLRMKKGSPFHVFNEKEEWLVKVEEMDKKKIKVIQVSAIKNTAEPQLKVALYQGIPKKAGLFELVVQKATEIGVTEIFPFVTERTENRRIPKLDRLHTIALEATEQCGRLTIPKIHFPVNYEEVIRTLKNAFIAYEYENQKYLSDYMSEIKHLENLNIIIGPEGGLSASEIDMAKDFKIKAFSLGKRILRTETAAISSLSLVLLNGHD